MPNTVKPMQDAAIAFFNSLPETVTTHNVRRAMIRFHGPAFITDDTIKLKFSISPKRLQTLLHTVGFRTELVTVENLEGDSALLGLMFALNDWECVQANKILDTFVEEVLPDFHRTSRVIGPSRRHVNSIYIEISQHRQIQ